MIDKQKVIQNIQKYWCSNCACYLEGRKCLVIGCEYRKLIDELNTEKEKLGKWLFPTKNDCTCSVCEEKSEWMYEFCPNCGTRMKNAIDKNTRPYREN